MNVAFYTEAGTKRGMGHLVRCRTLREVFNEKNIKTDFFLDSDLDFSNSTNEIQSFKWNSLPSKLKYDIIFLDSYEAGIETYNELKDTAKVTVYLDDCARLNYPEGVILNFALDADELFFKERKSWHHYLLGTSYVPIRKKFLFFVPTKQEQLFIMLGGYDVANLILDIIDILQSVNIKKVVVTNNHKNVDALSVYYNVTVLYNPSDDILISEMAKSAFAISTASMTVYELAYFEIPTLIVAVSKNQEIGSSQLIKHDLAAHFVNIKKDTWKNELLTYMNKLLHPSYIYTAQTNIDGHGAYRVVDYVTQLVKR